LPVWGQYDRGGAVDGIEPDFTANSIAAAFNTLHDAGVLKIDWKQIREPQTPFRTAEDVVSTFDRSVVHGGGAIICAGVELSYALVSGHIAHALFVDAPDGILTDSGSRQLVQLAVGNGEPAGSIYFRVDSSPSRVRYRIGLASLGLIGMVNWMRGRDLAWSPPEDPGQHDDDEKAQYLEDARERFEDDPVIFHAILDYAMAHGLD
jgi:hypothetical protein